MPKNKDIAAKRAADEAADRQEQFWLLGERAARRDLKIKELQAAQKADTDKMKELLGEGKFNKYVFGGQYILQASPNPVLKKELAEQLYGDQVKELVVTPAAVKRNLTEAQWSELYEVGYRFTFSALG